MKERGNRIVILLFLAAVVAGAVALSYWLAHAGRQARHLIHAASATAASTTAMTTPDGNKLSLASPAFQPGGMIPSKYTCQGDGLIPPLAISGVPAEAHSLVLILDDPDAPSGTFTHWVVWNMPADTSRIAEGMQPVGVPGTGSSGNLSYVGPCPPSGTHHYQFKLYALDNMLSIKQGSSQDRVIAAMNGHVIDQAELVGLYQKQ